MPLECFGNIDGAERRVITRAARKSVACKPLCQNLYVKVEPGVADLLLILEVAAAASRATDFLAARVGNVLIQLLGYYEWMRRRYYEHKK
jgi:hypothetical protein